MRGSTFTTSTHAEAIWKESSRRITSSGKRSGFQIKLKMKKYVMG